MDVLCVMFNCDQRGVLSTLGTPWTDEEIACSIRGNPKKNRLLLSELLDKNVAKRNDSGAVFNTRMVKDEVERQGDRERQSRFRHGDVTPVVTAMSQSSSSSTSKSNTTPPTPPTPPQAGGTNHLEPREWNCPGGTLVVWIEKGRRGPFTQSFMASVSGMFFLDRKAKLEAMGYKVEYKEVAKAVGG
jgi:hypothetical protein